jgi:thiol:disulfide interchange protein DsbD
MRRLFLPIFAFILFAIGTSAKAQIENPVTWQVTSNKLEGNRYEIIFNAKIENDWHLYSTKLPAGGPLPTVFLFKESTDFTKVNDVKEIGTVKREMDEVFNIEVSYYANEVRFVQEIELAKGKTGSTLSGNIEYQVCFEDKCVFHEKDFSVKVGELSAQVANKPVDDSSLLTFFLLAFLAGLAGLLTPCVFPMIPMTVSFFLNKQKNRFNAILNAIVFGVSIIAIYTSIGLLVSLTSLGADFANSIVSHWITNLIFFTLFIAFAASFFGLFEIMLPSSLSTRTDSKAEKGGFVGSFFMALTLVIVSLSCVGPIVGAILVEAAAGLGAKPIIGMLGFSLAFAIPFTLFAIFPSLLKSLPKSGGWLNSVKVVLGFIVLAFSLKFLSAVDSAYHLNILTRDVFLSIWIAIFIMMGMYLLGKIRFKHDSDPKPVGFFRMMLALASITFAIYLVPGLFGAPLQGLAGLLPSKNKMQFDLEKINRVAPTAYAPSAVCETPKYSDFLDLPLGLEGYFDYNQALACAREQKKPLFIDFVGHACANCKVMEQQVWSDPRVLEKLRSEFVIVALYVDERTKLPESEQYVSAVDGKRKETIGKRNSDFQISRFKMNGQPYYVLLGNNEEVLTEPYGFNTNVDEFIAFLDRGIEAFKKQ